MLRHHRKLVGRNPGVRDSEPAKSRVLAPEIHAGFLILSTAQQTLQELASQHCRAPTLQCFAAAAT
jgi:hypothetical protein